MVHVVQSPLHELQRARRKLALCSSCPIGCATILGRTKAQHSRILQITTGPAVKMEVGSKKTKGSGGWLGGKLQIGRFSWCSSRRFFGFLEFSIVVATADHSKCLFLVLERYLGQICEFVPVKELLVSRRFGSCFKVRQIWVQVLNMG